MEMKVALTDIDKQVSYIFENSGETTVEVMLKLYDVCDSEVCLWRTDSESEKQRFKGYQEVTVNNSVEYPMSDKDLVALERLYNILEELCGLDMPAEDLLSIIVPKHIPEDLEVATKKTSIFGRVSMVTYHTVDLVGEECKVLKQHG